MASFLENAIEEKNIRKIRSALGSYIMAEPTDRKQEIANAVEKINQLGIEIWEEHDGRELESDQSNWNKDYFTELQSQLESNFSRRRFNRTLQVGRYVYREELNKPMESNPRNFRNRGVRSEGQMRQENRRGSSGKYILAGMVVVAAVAAIYLAMKNQ